MKVSLNSFPRSACESQEKELRDDKKRRPGLRTGLTTQEGEKGEGCMGYRGHRQRRGWKGGDAKRIKLRTRDEG